MLTGLLLGQGGVRVSLAGERLFVAMAQTGVTGGGGRAGDGAGLTGVGGHFYSILSLVE